MELKMYIEILARRWRIVLLVAVVVICLAAVGSQFMSPKYQAVAILRIVTPLGGSSDNINYQTTFATRLANTYAQIATSEPVKEEIKEKLNLRSLPEVTVNVIPESEIIQIVVVSEDAALAANTANTLVDVLLSYQENAIATSGSGGLNILAARKDELQADLTEAQQQHDQLVKLYSQTAADMAILDRAIKMKEVTYQSLDAQYEQTLVDEAGYSTPNTKATKDTLIQEIERIKAELDTLYQQYKGLSTRSNEYQQKITLIRQTIQSIQSAYSDISSQFDNVSLANARQVNADTVEIVSPASEPAFPSGPSGIFIVGLGLICGLILGVLTAFVIENLDTRIFSLEQLRQITAVPVIGNVLTYLSNDSREIDRDPAIQRNYWLLRTEVQTMIQNGSHKTILVTSPNRKEGKSTIVFRLALGLAQNQLKVLIVDADLRSPEQYKLFDLTVEHGLSDFLSGELKSLKPIILKDVRPGLDLLPNITESANPIALIQPPQWKSLIQLFDAYDVVIFDTPAFLAVPDTLDLARVVDGVIIVAQWGHTLRSDIQTVCGYLESINSKMIGMVVNQLPRSTAGSYYSNIALSYRQPEKTIPNSL